MSGSLDNILKEVVNRLRAEFSPVAIYLFGSHAYGTSRPDSDLDLLVVVEDDPRSAFQRDAAAYRALIGIDMPVDVEVYTREEFESRSALPVSFERTVQEKGRLVYAA